METYTTPEGITHCSSCGTALSKTEIETENCSHCWQIENEMDEDYAENELHTDCPKCGRTYDDIDYDFQSCTKCGWDAEKNSFSAPTREPSNEDYLNGEADILTGHWN